MMFTTNDIADLLTTAREAVNRDLLPYLPDEQRMAALMVANALAIAGRYLVVGMGEAASPQADTSKASLMARSRAEVAVSNPKALPPPT